MKTSDLNALLKKFLQYKLTVAFAESCTAGLLASEMARGFGSSEVLLGSIVTYHPQAKQRLLGVRKETLTLYTAQSQQVTNEMVMGLHKQLPADFCVAITGLLGEGASESEDKPVGTVFITILYQNHAEELRQVFAGSCDSMRKQAVDCVFEHLQELMDRYQAQHATTAMEARTK